MEYSDRLVEDAVLRSCHKPVSVSRLFRFLSMLEFVRVFSVARRASSGREPAIMIDNEKKAAVAVQAAFRGHFLRASQHPQPLIFFNIKCHNLRARAVPSAYVVVKVERGRDLASSAQTQVKYNTPHPVYDGAMLKFADVSRPAIIVFEIHDRDFEGHDDVIAVRRLRLSELSGCIRHLQLWPTADGADAARHAVVPSVDDRSVTNTKPAQLTRGVSGQVRGVVFAADRLHSQMVIDFDYGIAPPAPSLRKQPTLVALQSRLQRGKDADLRAGMLAVLGPSGPLKERFCARLATRTRGCVLSVTSLVDAAAMAFALKSERRPLTPRQHDLVMCTSQQEIDEHRAVLEAGGIDTKVVSLHLRLLQAAMRHAPWPRSAREPRAIATCRRRSHAQTDPMFPMMTNSDLALLAPAEPRPALTPSLPSSTCRSPVRLCPDAAGAHCTRAVARDRPRTRSACL